MSHVCGQEQKNPYLNSHFPIISLIIIIVIFGHFLGWEKTNTQEPKTIQDYIYLDPVDTAFMVENLAIYIPNINENLNYLEETLFFNQPQSDEYLSKATGGNFITEQTQLEREYIIQKGDTITGIAKKFDMHVATIYNRNRLSTDSIENLNPGDKLMIPAYDQTDSKDWLVALNTKKEAERQRLLALQKKQELARKKQLAFSGRNTLYRDSTSGRSVSANTTGSNAYPYGWCTFYVASRRNVPAQWGNAGGWLSSARRAGYATGSTPKVGAIMVTSENSYYGHVAIVESVDGDNFTVSEMNYTGWGRVSSRKISTGSPVIKGYIY